MDGDDRLPVGARSMKKSCLCSQPLRRIAATGERGAGLAAAGIVIGGLTLLFAIAYWIVLARHMGADTHGGGGGGGGY
jgi:hypothetical protein